VSPLRRRTPAGKDSMFDGAAEAVAREPIPATDLAETLS
jgi:hypothetical protein